MPHIYAKKSLGQNFLRSPKALSDIVGAAEVKIGDIILEIGPGEGALTEALLKKCAATDDTKLIAIEKDDRLIPILEERFAREIAQGKLVLIHGDILELPLDSKKLRSLGLKDHQFKVVANIPYYITGAILPLLLGEKVQPQKAVLLVQREVAERVVARDGKESILSISVKVYGKARIAARVPRGAFVPAPNVDSAVLVIDDISKNFFKRPATLTARKKLSEAAFFKIIKTGFAHKRKLLGTNLEHAGYRDARKALEKIGKNPLHVRAEELTIKEWGSVAESV